MQKTAKKNSKKNVKTGELVYGIHPVLELLTQKRRKIFEIYISDSDSRIAAKIEKLLPNYPVAIHKLNKELLTHKLHTADHQGIGALAQVYPFRNKFFDPKKEPFLLLLDGLQDVRNLGAIIRSAYCTGVNGVIICRKNCAPLTATALKASAGLAERMDIYTAPSIESALIELKHAGYNIYIAALSNQANAFTLTYTKPLCLVIGSEATGVSPITRKAGTIVTLPQQNSSKPSSTTRSIQQDSDVSYNASVAAGILLSLIAYK